MKLSGWIIVLAALAALLPAGVSLAQQAAPRRLVEVEKGFFIEADIGPTLAVAGMGPLGLGMLTGIGFGYDVADWMSFDLGLMAIHWSSGSPQVKEIPKTTEPGSGGQQVLPTPDDLLGFVPNLNVKFSFISTYRWYVYARLGGGYLLPTNGGGVYSYDYQDVTDDGQVEKRLMKNSKPDFKAGQSPVVGGGLGFEYYTGLRHFSLGLEPRVLAVLGESGTGIAIAVFPSLKYTF